MLAIIEADIIISIRVVIYLHDTVGHFVEAFVVLHVEQGIADCTFEAVFMPYLSMLVNKALKMGSKGLKLYENCYLVQTFEFLDRINLFITFSALFGCTKHSCDFVFSCFNLSLRQ